MQFYSKQNKTPMQHIPKSRLLKTATFINDLSVPRMKKTSVFSLQFNKLNALTPDTNLRRVEAEPEYQNITMKTKYHQMTKSSAFTVPDNFRSVIPLKIFQTWHSKELPPDMKAATEQLQAQNPEFEYNLYDDEMCRDFILKNYDADVLYAYDKLKPGAYKADLWRYCVMYKYGGVYLDIKYQCANNFKLLLLSDKEYYVRDREYYGGIGIYQALLSCFPGNQIMFNCIKDAVENIKNNMYGKNALCVCGPQLISRFFTLQEINEFEYTFDGNNIVSVKDDLFALSIYENYRKDQSKHQKSEYYANLWENLDIYHYPTLFPQKTIDLSKTINKTIYDKNTKLYSGTPTIIEFDNKYLVNVRWINYSYNEDGSKSNIPQQWISLNSRFTLDLSFNVIGSEIFLQEDFEAQKNFIGMGLEDIRIIKQPSDSKYYYIATYYDNYRQITSTSSGNYNVDMMDQYALDRNIILPNFYDLNHVVAEKNWSPFSLQGDIHVVYKWHPLQIGKINYETNELSIQIIRHEIPSVFKNARGTSCGFTVDNEIWFVLHTTHTSKIRANSYDYAHFFAVFDLNMNYVKHSEFFKFEGAKIEFCLGIIVKDSKLILSYSVLDTKSMVACYDIDYIKNGIRWWS
jgi:hypothetical protein